MLKKLIAVGFLLQIFSLSANSATIQCIDTAKNHMNIDSSSVSACLDAGVGNINGNPSQDDFLQGVGSAYSLASKSDSANPFNISYSQTVNTKSLSSGTWSIDASFWSSFSSGAIGFKFGTGNKPDEWFVFQLVDGETSGNWDFINIFGKGGGLSHMNLYGVEKLSPVPVPAAIPLFLSALAAFGLFRRRQRKQA
ncbi:VPLPA-CTERM sorting domain-containing protein [Neptuniibacter sp.]|uniref:VPLPA-CTERM sorting domain-containing protein n=1 Tax=Neptuniibacter sp. TaxID=1962643 RepID=UPI003B5B9F4C